MNISIFKLSISSSVLFRSIIIVYIVAGPVLGWPVVYTLAPPTAHPAGQALLDPHIIVQKA